MAALVAPYFMFIQANGGLVSYFRQASAWAERDRAREPMVWPGLFDNPDGVSDAAKAGSVVAAVRDNGDGVDVLPRDRCCRSWRCSCWPSRATDSGLNGRTPGRSWPWWRCWPLALDAGFLRSPLEARLADPSVPIVILIAWLLVAAFRLLRSDESLVRRASPVPMAAASRDVGRCRSRSRSS